MQLWKLNRELRRPLRQIRGFSSFLIAYLLATPYYDLFLARKRRIYQGQLDGGERVALYLIFPSGGLLESHLEALRWFRSSGYSPLVVSNCYLDLEDRAKLLRECWHLIERPNFGYDFGGYRDGILWLGHRIKSLQRLAIFNDSVWFPLPGGKNWLDQAEKLQVSFAGAASNYGAARVDCAEYESLNWSYSSKHKNFHYCSYALLISQPLLSNRKHYRYWKFFRLSGNKKRTVRRGEIGLTQRVIRAGFSHAATLNIEDLDYQLHDLPDERLSIVFQRLIIPEDPRLQSAKMNLAHSVSSRGANWRKLTENFILTAVARQGVSYALPEFSTKELGFPFLKKSPVWLNGESSDITLELASELPDEFGRVIKNEVISLRPRSVGG